jgi:hypothetical protein
LRARWLLLAAAWLAPAAHALDAGDIVIGSLGGEVALVDGTGRAPQPGLVIALPATVSTGPDGAIELRQGATSISVGPDTRLEFPAPDQPGGPIDRIRQPSGNAFYDVGKRGSRKLRVETPYLVAVVKGTQFNVAARDDAATIALFEGRLEIRSAVDGEVIDLLAGEIASRHRDDPSIGVIGMHAPAATSAPATARDADDDSAALVPLPVSALEADLAEPVLLADARIDLGATDSAGLAPIVHEVPTPDIPGATPGAPLDVPLAGTPEPDPVAGDAGGVEVPAAPPAAPVNNPPTPVDGDDGGEGEVDLGLDLNPDDDQGPSNHGNGNAYGHDKDNANGEAKGHDKDDDTGLLGDIVEDVVNLLDSNLRRPGRK